MGKSRNAGRWRVKASLLAALMVALLGTIAPRSSRADIAPDIQSLLILRLLAYDHNLKARAGNTVVIVIAFKQGDADSEATGSGLAKNLESRAKEFTVLGLPVRQVMVPYASAAALEKTLVDNHAAATYVCPGLGDAVSSIATVTRRHSSVSISAVESFVRDGLGVGLLARAKPVLVNLPAVQAEGAHFDPAFLSLAEIIR